MTRPRRLSQTTAHSRITTHRPHRTSRSDGLACDTPQRAFPRSWRIAALVLGLHVSPSAVHAQVTLPSQVTPSSLAPAAEPAPTTIRIPERPRPVAPGSDTRLDVLLDDVIVTDGFGAPADETDAMGEALRGRRVDLDEIGAFAAAVEQRYRDAGYVLVRVVVPPQMLLDHGALRLRVVDGFIEAIDVSAVPETVRAIVAARVAGLADRPQVRLADIERSLLLAGDLPGLTLRSTLMPGTREGGTRLLLDGRYRAVTGSFGVNDLLASSLGTWQMQGTVALNGFAGFAEQLYGTLGWGPHPGGAFDDSAPLRIRGGGLIVPVGARGRTLNGEVVNSTTRSDRAPGVPAASGSFTRYALRLVDPLWRTRAASAFLRIGLEHVAQRVSAPAFGVDLSRDRYAVLRVGPDVSLVTGGGTLLLAGAEFSQGLGGRDARAAADSGVPLSRLGAGPRFSKLVANLRLAQPVADGIRLDLVGSVQSGAGKPLMRTEQFALDGPQAVSAYSAGTFSTDDGVSLRGELGGHGAFAGATLSPYVFAAGATGRLAQATAIEKSTIHVSAAGIGVRGRWGSPAGSATTFALEFARPIADSVGLGRRWHTSFSLVGEF